MSDEQIIKAIRSLGRQIATLNETLNRIENVLLSMKQQEKEYWDTWKNANKNELVQDEPELIYGTCEDCGAVLTREAYELHNSDHTVSWPRRKK